MKKGQIKAKFPSKTLFKKHLFLIIVNKPQGGNSQNFLH